MPEIESDLPWYHGSQVALTELRSGSSITQNPAIARVFSHRPSLVAQLEDGTIKHDGTIAGFLYVVAEEIAPDDVFPHPHPINESRWEWVTRRPLLVRLVEHTTVRDEERLTEGEIAELRRKQEASGQETFADGS